MKNEDIKIEKMQNREKTRKFKAAWTLEDVKNYTEKDLRKLSKDRADAFDKWAWETGSDNDLDKFKALDEEVKVAASCVEHDRIIDEIMRDAANEIANNIDQSILHDIFKVNKDE